MKNNKNNPEDPKEPDDFDENKIANFIDNLIKYNIQKERELEESKISSYDNLLSFNSEWLDSFLIIGYDLDGREVVLSKIYSEQDNNALLYLLKKVFINYVVKNEMEN